MNIALNEKYNEKLVRIKEQGYVTLNDWYELYTISIIDVDFIKTFDDFEKNTGSKFNVVLKERIKRFQEINNKLTTYFTREELFSPDPISIFTDDRVVELSSDSGYEIDDITNFFIIPLKKYIDFIINRYT